MSNKKPRQFSLSGLNVKTKPSPTMLLK